MSISTHINEYTSVSDFLSDVSAYDGTDIEAVEQFLREIYPDDNSADEYDMDKGSNDPQFTIKVIDNSMDDYAEENFLRIHLPSRKDADELASMLNGSVTYDGSKKPKAKAKKRKPLYIVSVARLAKNARSLLAAKDKQVKLWVLPPTVHHTLEEAQKKAHLLTEKELDHIWAAQEKRVAKATIKHGVYTDNEGCSYNSIDW